MGRKKIKDKDFKESYSYRSTPGIYYRAEKKAAKEGVTLSKKIHQVLCDYTAGKLFTKDQIIEAVKHFNGKNEHPIDLHKFIELLK